MAARSPAPKHLVARLRTICLALPEAEERETFGGPTFRVRDKIFAMETGRRGGPSFWCKAPPGSQAVLVGADPSRFFVPPYVGSKGWIGVRLVPPPDWDEIDAAIASSPRNGWRRCSTEGRRTAPLHLRVILCHRARGAGSMA